MDLEQDTKRMNVQVDRLSSLPDDLIHKILSFIDIKHAIKTSVLSSRWRFIWTSMPYLKFSTVGLSSLSKFSEFVTRVLYGRNTEIDVTSVDLSFRGQAGEVFVKKILDYAFSHNVQELTITCLYDNNYIAFPLSLFSSQSLKHLTLGGNDCAYFITLTSTWALPALTSLYLKNIIFNDNNIDLFSTCPNLKNLTLCWCQQSGKNGCSIHHSRLSNLTLDSIQCDVNVVAPQIKDLTFTQCGPLRSLHFSADSVRSLEKLNFICYAYQNNAYKALDLLQQMHNVNFLTLNLEFVECLSSCVELISHRPSPFANLKSLKIYPDMWVSEWDRPEKVIIPAEVINYFLDGSSSVTFSMVSREEIIETKKTTSAQNRMAELEELLEQEKVDIETEMAHMHEQGNTQLEPEMQPQIGVSMDQIYYCWEDLSVRKRKEKVVDIVCKLQHIKEILTELPASKRDMIQPRFSGLCVEADIVMNKITDCIKIQCDENQSRLSGCFHEILHPSS